MNNKIIFIALFGLTALRTQAQDSSLNITSQEVMPGMQKHSMLAADNTCLCTLSTNAGSALAVLDSPMFEAIDKSMLPVEVLHLISMVKEMKTNHDLDSLVVIGDVYTLPAHRGNGYASQLINEMCKRLFGQGIKTVSLMPDPFEYEDDKQVLVNDESKKQKLVAFYQKCGFKKDNDADTCMYRCQSNS